MLVKQSISQVILWLFVIVLGIIMGGGIYEARVLVPLWSAAPPDSVIAYYHHNVADPQFVPDQGGRFWIFVTPLGALLSLAMLVSAFWASPATRKWRLGAALIALITYAATALWFVPTIIKLGGPEVLTMRGGELARLANMWSTLNWVRAALLVTAWLAALRALSLSATKASETMNAG